MNVQFLFGTLIIFCIPLVAYYTHSLSRSGVVGAVLVGALIYYTGGWQWFTLLLSFFGSSSILSHLGKQQKVVAGKQFEKGERRDIFQVFANGGAAALASLGYGLSGNAFYFFAFLGTLGTVNADTWATEVGLLSTTPPRSILSGKRVPPGTSGALSLLGSLASCTGALFIGLVALCLQPFTAHSYTPIILLIAAGVGGSIGSLLDSLLGATIQRLHYCPSCQEMTEKKMHSCGTVTTPVRGFSRINNDVVNFFSALGGGLVTPLLVTFITQ